MTDETPPVKPLPPPGYYASQAEGAIKDVCKSERLALAQVYATLEAAVAVHRLREELVSRLEVSPIIPPGVIPPP